MPQLHLASFKVDVSVPLGHPLCGGWIKPAEKVTDPLYAIGIVILGNEAPVVLCAVDWTGICNDANSYWREQLAKAAHTTPERVAIHAVHQHNAPFVDLAAQKLVNEQKGLATIFEVKWFQTAAEKVADAVRASLAKTQPVTHVAASEAKVDKVASNRRVIGPDGKIKGWRGSACKDAGLRALPDGVIDPMLKTATFWNGDRKLAALHYYTTHPMSYYGDGLVTSDFVGLARERRAAEEPGVTHIYFTGCAGNIAAGKYNDGSKEMRPILTGRIHKAMVESEKRPNRSAANEFHWQTRMVILPPRSDVSEPKLVEIIGDAGQPTANRNRAAMKLSYRRRAVAAQPIILSCLQLGDGLRVLHLPAESFVEFQLYAQEQRPGGFVAVAAYGDGGPWYIPIKNAYAEGGYEPSQAFVDPEADAILRAGIRDLLKLA